MSKRLFGTDGVRGVAGEWPLDRTTVRRLGAAVARLAGEKLTGGSRNPRIVLGRDTRESGEWIAREFARGAAATGAEVVDAGILPTPGVAFVARTTPFDLGIVLSASHNPYGDNGIKVFSGRGQKFSEDDERAVESLVADSSWSVEDAPEVTLQCRTFVEPYLDYLVRLLPAPGQLSGARLAIDMANGATTATAVQLFRRVGFDVVAAGDRPDGRNINQACGSTHPALLAGLVVSEHCRLGVAFDGDGDRAILVDHRGHVVDGDAVLLMLGAHFKRQGKLPGDTVVATVMSNVGLEIAFRDRGIRMLRTPVGDRYVMEEMLAGGYALGGEQSGHIILAEHLATGDGMATALAVLRVMAESGRELADLAGELRTYPQTLVNVRVKEKKPVAEVAAIQAAIERVEAALAGSGRVLVRYSGTEPLLRIMIEGEDQATVQAWAEEIADAVRSSLA